MQALPPTRSQAALFNVMPCLEKITMKYAIPVPYSDHDVMVLNLWVAQTFERVFAIGANIRPEKYDYQPLDTRDLTILADKTLDELFTQTVQFQMINQVADNLGPRVTTFLSANTLIVEF